MPLRETRDDNAMDINRYYETIAEEIKSKVGRLNAFTKHGPSIGSYHEQILKDAIFEILPKRFSVKSGIIVDDENRVSNQQDIIIVDENLANTYLFKDGDFAVVHFSSVVFTVEVKTTLNKLNFIDAMNNCSSVTKLGGANQIRTSAFFFYCNKINTARIEKWYKSCQVDDRLNDYPTQIMFFNAGILQLWLDTIDGTFGHRLLWDVKQSKKIDGDLVAMFLGTIRRFCSDHAKEKMPVEFRVLDKQRLTISNNFFAFGRGAVEKETPWNML
jgi:hypothetical protein